MVEEAVGERVGRWRWLSWRRLLALFVVVVVVAAGVVWVVVPYVQELFKREGLDLRGCWWTRNQEGSITQATLRLTDNGTKTLTIDTVALNQTLLNPTDWGGGGTLSPRTWCWMYIAPESIVFEEGDVYNLTIGTQAGGRFSYTVRVGPENVVEEEARIEGALFYPSQYSAYYGNIVWVSVGNNGSVPVIVVEGWWNGTQQNITKKWFYPGFFGGEARSVTFHIPWDTGDTFTFTLRTACGNTYTYTCTAD